jgi:hypothetical protein
MITIKAWQATIVSAELLGLALADLACGSRPYLLRKRHRRIFLFKDTLTPAISPRVDHARWELRMSTDHDTDMKRRVRGLSEAPAVI